MKVLLITWACDLEDVSEPQVSATWVTEISRHHEVTLFAVSRPDRFGCVREQFGQHLQVVEWRDIEVPAALDRFRAIVNPGFVPYARRARKFLPSFVADRNFDVIHHLSPFAWRYPSPATGLGVPLIRGPVGGGLPTPPGLRAVVPSGQAFMALRSLDSVRRRYDPVLRRWYRKTDHVIFAAPYVGEVMRDMPIAATSVESEIGLSEQEFPPAGGHPPKSPLELLYVGRVSGTKGLAFAISALAQLRDPRDVVLRVVGDGEDLPRCRELAHRLGVADRVDFRGWLPHAEVTRFYREADVFCFPSVREPSGTVVLEAMAHGLPVVVCDYGGPGYAVGDDSGVRLQVTDEGALVAGITDALETFIARPDLIVTMGGTARRRCHDMFGWEAKLRRVDALYEKVRDEYAIQGGG